MPEVIEVRSQAEANAVMRRIVAETMNRTRTVQFRHLLRSVILPKLQKWHGEYFAKDAGPSGEPWEALHPITIKRKGHATILEETRAMLQSLIGKNQHSIARIRKEGNTETLEYGTRRPHAWRHQQGVGRPGQRLPKREFVGIDNSKVNEIVAAIADEAVQQIKDSPSSMRAAS